MLISLVILFRLIITPFTISEIVESYKSNVVEEVQESLVVVPKFVFKFVEEETPINISLSGILQHPTARNSDSSCHSNTKVISGPLTINMPASPELSASPMSPLPHITSNLSFSAPFSYSSDASLINDGVKNCTCPRRNLALSDFSETEV